jgi:hypothetical protein
VFQEERIKREGEKRMEKGEEERGGMREERYIQ